MINSLKAIINQDGKTINIPEFGKKDILTLHGANYDFLFDMNRSGHRAPKCTFQLRESHNKSEILLRFDIIGKAHPNPPGNYKYSNKNIDCPHVHLANYKEYGIAVALPLSDPLVRIGLNGNGVEDLVYCLQETLRRVNTSNYRDFKYNQTGEMIP